MDNRDLAYFDQMIEWLRANHCFDAKKLFVMGYSNGAGFTSVLACERASLHRRRRDRVGQARLRARGAEADDLQSWPV